MAGIFQKLPLKKFPKTELRTDSREQKQWKAFQVIFFIIAYFTVIYKLLVF